jgi:hypothetical protein
LPSAASSIHQFDSFLANGPSLPLTIQLDGKRLDISKLKMSPALIESGKPQQDSYGHSGRGLRVCLPARRQPMRF